MAPTPISSFVRHKGKDGIALRMHEDVSSPMPPFHRAMHENKALEQELASIEGNCKLRGATQKHRIVL